MDLDIADRFSCRLVWLDDDASAHAVERGDDRGARWVEPDIVKGESSTWQRGSGDQPEGRAGNVAGHGEVAGLRDLAADDGDRVAAVDGVDAE